jgi:hypothetical protein
MRVVICQPSTINVRRVGNCPTCKARRRFAGFDAPWYGITLTCCACGDTWSGGERMERPFARGWREKSAGKAKAAWATGVRIGSPEHRAFLDAELGGSQLAPAGAAETAEPIVEA